MKNTLLASFLLACALLSDAQVSNSPSLNNGRGVGGGSWTAYLGKSPSTGSPYSMDFKGADPARRNGAVFRWEE